MWANIHSGSLTAAEIPFGEGTILVAGDDAFVERSPQGRDGLAGHTIDDRLQTHNLIFAGHVLARVDIDDVDFWNRTEDIVSGVGDEFAGIGESTATDGSGGIELVDASAGFTVPNSQGRVCTAGHNSCCVP